LRKVVRQDEDGEQGGKETVKKNWAHVHKNTSKSQCKLRERGNTGTDKGNVSTVLSSKHLARTKMGGGKNKAAGKKEEKGEKRAEEEEAQTGIQMNGLNVKWVLAARKEKGPASQQRTTKWNRRRGGEDW